MTKTLFASVVFLSIYGPIIPRLSGFGDTSFLVALMVAMIAFFKGIKLKHPTLLIFIPFFFLFFYLAWMASFSLSVDLSHYLSLILKPLRIFIVFLGAYCLVSLILNKNLEIHLLNWIFFSITFHAAIMVAQLLFPDFKDFIYGFLNTGEYRSTFSYQFRMGGLSGGPGGAVLSVVQSVGVILLPFMVSKKNPSPISKPIAYISAFICFLSVVFCGRSGLLAIILFLPLAIILASSNKLYSIYRLMVFAVISVVFLIAIQSLVEMYTRSEDIAEGGLSGIAMSLSRTFDSIFEIINTSNFQDDTIVTLISHILVPTDLKVLFFGDPVVFSQSQLDRTLDSDIGYIRDLWGMGIFGALVFWVPIFLILTYLFTSKQNIFIKNCAILVGLLMIFFHMKESFLYVRMLFPIFSLLFFFSILDNRSKNLKLTKIRQSNDYPC